MKRILILCSAVFTALCGYSSDWVYDSGTGTVSDEVWTFKANVDAKTSDITFDTCWGYPSELSTLDLSKPVTDGGSKRYVLRKLGNMFGNWTNYGKSIAATTNGMTLAELILPTRDLTTIGCGCFAYLPALTNIVNFLPDCVTTLDTGSTFYRVPAKQDLRLVGVGSVNRFDFQGSAITSVTFGPDIGNVGPGATGQGSFSGCANITNYTFSPYGSRGVITKFTLSLKSGSLSAFDLRGVKALGGGGAFEDLRFSKIVFDDVMDDMADNEAFCGCSSLNTVMFRGRPPSRLNICYLSYKQKTGSVYYYYPDQSVVIPTYVRRPYLRDWAKYAADGVIAESGSTFSAEICNATGVPTEKRPLLLVPTVKIANSAEFVSAVTSDPDGELELIDDIDLSGSGYVTIPEFTGCLDGNGHTVTGLGAQPLFGILGGVVADLTVDGAVDGSVTTFQFGGDAVAGVFCKTNDSGTILRSTVKNYRLAGSGQGCTVGLFAAVAVNDAVFEGCVTDASCACYANNSANGHLSYGGGVVGTVRTSGIPERAAYFVGCTNNAAGGFNMECYSGGAFGGIVGYFSDLNYACGLWNCVNFGAISSNKKGAVMGGIFGSGGAAAKNDGKLLLAGCENQGVVSASAANPTFYLGGVAGICGNCIVMSNCVNRADIVCTSGASYCGGICNNPSGELASYMVQRYFNCANYGDITAVTSAGGLNSFSRSNKDYAGTGIYYLNCANYGTVTAATTDEFVPAGLESKNTMYGARSNRKVGNSFAMTRNVEFYNDTHPEKKWWFTVEDCVTAADEGYAADAAVAALNVGSEALGLGRWRKGAVNGRVVPELVAFAPIPVVVSQGLRIFFR